MEKDGEKSCDITITNENWKEEFIVLVKAKIDNLFDEDKTRKVEFSGEMKSEFVDSMEHTLQIIYLIYHYLDIHTIIGIMN
jgi:hypothetical protein